MSFPLKLKIKFPGGSASGSAGHSSSSHQPGKKRKRPEDGRAGPGSAPPGFPPGRAPDQPAEAVGAVPKRIKLKSTLTAGSGQQHGAARPPKPKLKLKYCFILVLLYSRGLCYGGTCQPMACAGGLLPALGSGQLLRGSSRQHRCSAGQRRLVLRPGPRRSQACLPRSVSSIGWTSQPAQSCRTSLAGHRCAVAYK